MTPLSHYHANGGLIQILKRNSGGNSPRVWIVKESDGTFRQTFASTEGAVGGEPVPFGAFEKNKVFRPEIDVVVEYLQTFGLSSAEAKSVIEHVGFEPPDAPHPATM